jgi:hypothetical protein
MNITIRSNAAAQKKAIVDGQLVEQANQFRLIPAYCGIIYDVRASATTEIRRSQPDEAQESGKSGGRRSDGA